MNNFEQKIEKCRSELESLYLRLRSGEDCMAQVLELSKRLDVLLTGQAVKKEIPEPEVSNQAECR